MSGNTALTKPGLWSVECQLNTKYGPGQICKWIPTDFSTYFILIYLCKATICARKYWPIWSVFNLPSRHEVWLTCQGWPAVWGQVGCVWRSGHTFCHYLTERREDRGGCGGCSPPWCGGCWVRSCWPQKVLGGGHVPRLVPASHNLPTSPSHFSQVPVLSQSTLTTPTWEK